MNFKAWNMKKGLKRIWILGSVIWLVVPFFRMDSLKWFEKPFGENLANVAFVGFLCVVLWWAVFYLGIWVIRGAVFLGRWVARGFKDDDDKKADF